MKKEQITRFKQIGLNTFMYGSIYIFSTILSYFYLIGYEIYGFSFDLTSHYNDKIGLIIFVSFFLTSFLFTVIRYLFDKTNNSIKKLFILSVLYFIICILNSFLVGLNLVFVGLGFIFLFGLQFLIFPLFILLLPTIVIYVGKKLNNNIKSYKVEILLYLFYNFSFITFFAILKYLIL